MSTRPADLMEPLPGAGPWRDSPRAEVERRGVHAVPQARRLRTVLEHVAEVRAAAPALDLGARHEEARVLPRLHAPGRGRRGEARPAGAGLELRLRLEQRVAATGARVGSRPVVIPVLARERALRSLLAQDPVL